MVPWIRDDSDGDDNEFLLQFVPMPVLFGLFFYMGVSALKGLQVRMFTLCSFEVISFSQGGIVYLYYFSLSLSL